MTTLQRFLAVTACTIAVAGTASAQVGTGFNVNRPVIPPAKPINQMARGVNIPPQINTFPGFLVPPPQFNPGALQLSSFVNTPTVANPYAFNPGVYSPFNPTPPIAVQQPSYFLWRGPDLQVNPATGTVYRPQSGVVRMADGSTFYRVLGTGAPDGAGNYATGTGVYFNPTAGTYYNPASGVIARPGTTGLLPYIW